MQSSQPGWYHQPTLDILETFPDAQIDLFRIFSRKRTYPTNGKGKIRLEQAYLMCWIWAWNSWSHCRPKYSPPRCMMPTVTRSQLHVPGFPPKPPKWDRLHVQYHFQSEPPGWIFILHHSSLKIPMICSNLIWKLLLIWKSSAKLWIDREQNICVFSRPLYHLSYGCISNA